MLRTPPAISDGREVGRAVPARSSVRLSAIALVFALLLALVPRANAAAPDLPGAGPSFDEPLFSTDSPFGPIDYVLGRGLSLGRTGFHVGGFSSLEIDKEQPESGKLEFDSLNFLILWEPFSFFRGFAELELDGLFAWDMETGKTMSNVGLVVERLYGDIRYDDAANVRVGKFQTPIGIWNQVPAEPFTWTANEPILVENAFDEHQTGVALFGSFYPGANELEYWVYGQVMDPLDPSVDPIPAERSVGGRLRYAGSLGNWAVGSSFLAAERDGDWSYLGGLDALWQVGPLELQGEWSIVRGDIPERDLWGIYVQSVYDLGYHFEFLRGLHLVGRYEYFAPSDRQPNSHVGNVGLSWTPASFLILKAGYQLTNRQTDFVSRGFFSSISILF